MLTFNRWIQMKYDRLKKIKPLLELAEDITSDRAFPKEIKQAVYLKTYLESNNASEEYKAKAMRLYAQYERELKAQEDAETQHRLENPPIGDSTSDIILGADEENPKIIEQED